MNLIKLKILIFWNNYNKEKSLESLIQKSHMIHDSHYVYHEDGIGSYWVRIQIDVSK